MGGKTACVRSREQILYLRRLLEGIPCPCQHVRRQLPHLGEAPHGNWPLQHHRLLTQESKRGANFQLQSCWQLLPCSYLLCLHIDEGCINIGCIPGDQEAAIYPCLDQRSLYAWKTQNRVVKAGTMSVHASPTPPFLKSVTIVVKSPLHHC